MAAASPKFSEGSDEPRLTQELDSLLSRWTLTTDGQGIERSFKFKTFAKTWVRLHPSDLHSLGLFLTCADMGPGLHDSRVSAVQDQEPPPRVVKRKSHTWAAE